MGADNTNYGQTSITSLKDEEKVRRRPTVIFGTNNEMGCAHGIYEIIANAIDEAREGFGKQIRIRIDSEHNIEVSDDGRGVPMGWNEKEGKYNWELVFCTLYASGKLDGSNYSEALGLNGLGATAMQYASEYMDVYSTSNGLTSIMHFKKGKPVGKLQVVPAIREGSGTTIKFKPDKEVFINIDNPLPAQYFINILRRQAMLHDGLEFLFSHPELGKEVSLKYDRGILEFVDKISENTLLKQPLYFTGEADGFDDENIDPTPYHLKMRMALTFSRSESLVELYHNGSNLYEGGYTYDGMKLALTKAFEDHAKDIGRLNKSDKFNFKDIESILIAVGDTNAPGNRTFFKNQTKAAILNPFIKKAFVELIYNNVRNWLRADKEAEAVLNEVIANKQAREEADKVSKKVIQKLSKPVGFGNMPKKFVNCKSKDIFEREIYFVEGDSAAGSVTLARNSQFQAVMPVGGKILNCLKAELTRILANDAIIELIRILGCGIEATSKHIDNIPKFDINKLNWGKIIICTDADLDGMQIRCLILTMIYRLCPTLLKMGKVYIAETPLFEISYKKETYFAYNEKEKVEILDKLHNLGIKDSQIKIQRSKGLGENDSDMMSKSTMEPATRRLVPVEYPENDENVAACFNALLGDDLETRRVLIKEYFSLTHVDID